MNRFLITAAAVALLGAPAAYAQSQQQPDDHHPHGQGDRSQDGGGSSHGGPSNGGSPSNGPGGHGVSSNGAGSNGVSAGHVVAAPTRPSSQGSPQGGQPDWNAYYRNNPDLQRAYKQNQQSSTYHESIDAFAQRHYQEHGKAEGRALPTVQGGGGASNAQGASRYRSLQRNEAAPRHFRAPTFRWPGGQGYRRFTFGEFLPQVFLSQSYWLYDYGDYGLPYPPPGTFWVRYGPDALLVDRYSGEVIEVFYGMFY